MFTQILNFLFPARAINAKIEEQKKILAFELGTTYPRAERILAPCQKLIELGVSDHEVADLVAEADLYKVKRFAMKLKPSLAEKFAKTSVDWAKEHMKLCGHGDRAHWARACVRFADECYKTAGYKPNSFNDLFAEVMQKTAWAFEDRTY